MMKIKHIAATLALSLAIGSTPWAMANAKFTPVLTQSTAAVSPSLIQAGFQLGANLSAQPFSIIVEDYTLLAQHLNLGISGLSDEEIKQAVHTAMPQAEWTSASVAEAFTNSTEPFIFFHSLVPSTETSIEDLELGEMSEQFSITITSFEEDDTSGFTLKQSLLPDATSYIIRSENPAALDVGTLKPHAFTIALSPDGDMTSIAKQLGIDISGMSEDEIQAAVLEKLPMAGKGTSAHHAGKAGVPGLETFFFSAPLSGTENQSVRVERLGVDISGMNEDEIQATILEKLPLSPLHVNKDDHGMGQESLTEPRHIIVARPIEGEYTITEFFDLDINEMSEDEIQTTILEKLPMPTEHGVGSLRYVANLYRINTDDMNVDAIHAALAAIGLRVECETPNSMNRAPLRMHHFNGQNLPKAE